MGPPTPRKVPAADLTSGLGLRRLGKKHCELKYINRERAQAQAGPCSHSWVSGLRRLLREMTGKQEEGKSSLDVFWFSLFMYKKIYNPK